MRYAVFIFLLVVIASCVSNKQVQYLQKDDVNPKDDEINVDSILRSYEIELYDYKVQPQDVLWINVESLTEEGYDIFSFSGGSEINAGAFNNNAGALYGELVDEQGEIDFPVIGKVVVEGLTLFEIQDKIKEIAANYVEEPVVKVRLLNFRFTVLGEVNREGNITTFNNRVSLLEAIGLAGGLSELGDRSTVKLIRQHGVKHRKLQMVLMAVFYDSMLICKAVVLVIHQLENYKIT